MKETVKFVITLESKKAIKLERGRLRTIIRNVVYEALQGDNHVYSKPTNARLVSVKPAFHFIDRGPRWKARKRA